MMATDQQPERHRILLDTIPATPLSGGHVTAGPEVLRLHLSGWFRLVGSVPGAVLATALSRPMPVRLTRAGGCNVRAIAR